MKEQSGNEEKKKKPKMNKEKKFYLFTAIGCAAVLIAIIIVAVAITNSGNVNQGQIPPASSSEQGSSGDTNPPGGSEDKPVVTLPEGMVLPLATTSVGNDYGFFHNQTLNNYYEHKGVDFVASAGTEVFAVEDGVVESIYKDDLLLGTEIVVAHENGLKSVYRFVTEAEGLKVGAQVKKGDVIATVAEANGNEYKDGAHLHFEILENGKNVDPNKHLTLDEK